MTALHDLTAFLSALHDQAESGTDHECPFCYRHDPDLDGRLILDRQDSRELREKREGATDGA